MGLGKRTNPLLKYISCIIIYHIYFYIHIHSTSIRWFEIDCAFLLFSMVIHFLLEGKPYLHLSASFPRLDIDEFQAALRKVRVYKKTFFVTAFARGYFVPWQWEVNLETMEALGPKICKMTPKKGFPWYIVLWCFFGVTFDCFRCLYFVYLCFGTITVV